MMTSLQSLDSWKRSLAAKQLPRVVGSGSSKKEAMASPRVISGSVGLFQAIKAITIIFTKLQHITITIIVTLNWTLQCSSTC